MQIYYADIQLFPELKDGLLDGVSHHLSTKEVTVCAQCGRAEFVLDDSSFAGFAIIIRPLGGQKSFIPSGSHID
jgi:hypothetical protein